MKGETLANMSQIITGKFNGYGMKECHSCNIWYREEGFPFENSYIIGKDYTGEMGTCGIASCDYYGMFLCVECTRCGTEVGLPNMVCIKHYRKGESLKKNRERLDKARIL